MSVNSKMTALANSIRAKSGVSGLLSIDGMKTAVDSIQTGGTVLSAEEKDVNFIDYDGTILYSYTLSEAQALTELPELPSNDGLICQGWNWSLADIKALNRPITVGAMYTTNDGKTRLKIRIDSEGRMTVPLAFKQTVANGVSIDWGDGSAAETLAETVYKTTYHTYSDIGNYTITLTPVSGSFSFSSYVFGNANNANSAYLNMLQEVKLGDSITSIGMYAFSECSSLSTITIPNNITSISSYAFKDCYSLVSANLPNGITDITNYLFDHCYSLARVSIPNSVLSVGNNSFGYCLSLANVTLPDTVSTITGYAFRNCYSLSKIVIPSDVTVINGSAFYNCSSLVSVKMPNGITSIGSSAFGFCYCVYAFDFSTFTAIPTLVNTNAFNEIATDCKMLIPSALYDEWSAAENWSTYVSYMVAV